MSRRTLRRATVASGIAAILGLLTSARAWAGTDVFQNIGPASPLGAGARFLRYPLSHYGLDQHFTVVSASITGGVDVSGLLPEIAWFFASLVWLVTGFLAKVVVELFAFAFSLDLVNGSSATGGAGALGPVSQAIHSIYADVFGAPWLILAFSAVALWAMWRALVQRRYVDTAGALALSLIYIVVAFFFVAAPGQTIGRASQWTNEMSRAFLSIGSHGTPSGGEAATADDADQLWGLLVERPWSVLEFGGLEHCVIDGTGDEDSDPDSAPVRPLSENASEDSALARRLASGTEVGAEGKTCVNNENKYAAHFLRFGIGTDERDEEYDALDHGDSSKLPEADDEAAGYHLGVADKPATDAMEEGGQYQRLLIALIVAVGETGAFILLGALSIGVILSQVLLLLLLAFSPVALVAAAIPGRGHDFFKAWLEKLGGYLLRKAAYSLVLAVLLAVNSAIGEATSQLGWLFAFGLQAAFFWAVLIQRHTLVGGIVGLATGPRAPGRDLAVDAVALYGGARLGTGALRGVGGAGGSALSRFRDRKAEGDPRRPSIGGVRESRVVGVAGSETSPDPSSERTARTAEALPDGTETKPAGEATAAGARGGSKAAGPEAEEVSASAGEAEGKASRKADREGAAVKTLDGGGAEEGTTGGADLSADGDRQGASGSPRRPGARRRPDVVTDRDDGPDAPRHDRPRPEGDRVTADRKAPADAERDGAEESGAPARRPRNADRGRPTQRSAGAGGRPGSRGPERVPTGRAKASAPAGSDLSEELRGDRERTAAAHRTPVRSSKSPGSPEQADAGDPPARPDDRGGASEEPSSPPRRRRLRRPGRGLK